MTKTNVPRLRFREFSGEWKEDKLGDVTIRFDNKRIPIKESDRIHGYVPYYGANGIQDYVVGMTHTGNNILIAEDGASDINNYPVFYTEGNIWVNNHAHVLKSKKNKSDSLFISYCLKMIPYRKYLTGNGRYKLNADILMGMRVNIPSLLEQQKIGDFFAKQDKLIELQTQKVDQLKKLKRGYLQKMFTEEGETVPRLRFSGFSGEWMEDKLGDVTIRFDNKRIPIKESDRIHGCVPYYGANGIQDYVEGMTHTGNNILIAEDGASDINNYPVFHTEGNIWVNNHAHVLKSQKNKSDSLFISYCLKMIPYRKYLTGNGRYKLNADILMEIKVNIPSLLEQQKIGSFFAKIDKLIEEQSNKLDLLKQQKKAYLQKMFV